MNDAMEKVKEKPNRLLLTMKYLWEKTDIDHPASVRDIAAYLEENGLTATRKTIYHDVEQLRAAGWISIAAMRIKTFTTLTGESLSCRR